MHDVVIVAATRTAVGSFQGSLASVAAVDLGAAVIRQLLARTGVDGAPDPALPSVRYDFRVARRAAHDKGGRVGADPSKVSAG